MILVTGVSGFIGGRFAQLTLKDEEIIGIDLNEFYNYKGISCKSIDIRSPESIESIEKEYGITSIVHCAAIISPSRCQSEPRLAYETNIVGTLNMLDFARRRDIRKFIYISSAGIYKNSEPEDIVTEDWPVAPTDIYNISKVASESTVSYFTSTYGFDAIALRITAPYGPDMYNGYSDLVVTDSLNRHTLIFADKCSKSQDIIMPFGGDHTINYTYVDDIASAIRQAIKAKLTRFEVFNITSGKNYKISDLGKAIKEICPEIEVRIGPGNLLQSNEEREPMLTRLSIQKGVFDISKANKLIGYSPKFELLDGMKGLISDIRRLTHR